MSPQTPPAPVPKHRPVIVRTGAVILNNGWPMADPDLDCTCGAGNHATVHIGQCTGERRYMVCEPITPTYPVLVDASGKTLISKRRRKRTKPAKGRGPRTGEHDRKLTMQFWFSRPINLALWKQIKAPKGWRKCPTNKKTQADYKSVRFYTNNLAHALTPDDVEELRAMLCLSLEESF